MFRRKPDSPVERIPLSDPMSSQYATGGPAGYEAPKKNNKKRLLWIIGAIVAVVVILGAVLGGVLGTRSKNSDTSDNNSSGSNNTALPSGVSSVNPHSTGADGQEYLAIATNSEYMLPVYATGVSTPKRYQFRADI